MAFKAGDPKPEGSGRQKGQPNVLTRTVKETVLAVFNKMQENPEHDLLSFAKKHPRDFYNIAAKLIPTEISAKVEATTYNFTIEPLQGCEPIKDE